MRRLLTIVAVLFAVASPFATAAATAKDSAWQIWQQGGYRGVNVLLEATEGDLLRLRTSWRVNLVRVQLIYPDDTLRRIAAQGLRGVPRLRQQLHDFVAAAGRQGLDVVLDLHRPEGDAASETARLWKEEKLQQNLIAVWAALASEFAGNARIVGYDILNEPTPYALFTNSSEQLRGSLADWNLLASRIVARIREADAETPIIVECTDWAQAFRFRELDAIPARRIVYSFHMYWPHEFTHQGINEFTARYPYPFDLKGRAIDREALARWILPVKQFAARHRVPVFVGEFGANFRADDESRTRYLRDVLDLVSASCWSWAFHAYRIWDGWMPGPAMLDLIREHAASPPCPPAQ